MPHPARLPLVVAAALALAVGGAARAEVVENRAYAGEKTLIRWAFWGGEETVVLFRRIGERFVEAHPEIAVDIVIYPWGQYWQKLQTQTASGLAPDVLSIYSGQAGIWINHGALRPLDSLARGLDRSAYYPGAIQNFEWDGALYALPIEVAVYALVYSSTGWRSGASRAASGPGRTSRCRGRTSRPSCGGSRSATARAT